MDPSNNLYLDLPHMTAETTAVLYSGRAYSYRELLERIDRFAAHIRAQAVSDGERVGIMSLSPVDHLAAVYGCAKAGAVAVPVSAEDRVRAHAAFRTARARLVLTELPASAAPSAVEPTRCKEAMVIFTSGTTSEGRKGVILGHAGISSTSAFMNRAMDIDGSIRECVMAPLDHAFGFGRCHSVLTAGGTLVLSDRPLDFGGFFESLTSGGVNALSTVPSILASLLKVSRKRLGAAGAGLRWIQTGAMRFDRVFRDELCEVFPKARIFLHYGLSEAMRVTFMELQSEANKRHTEGRPADGVEIAILDESLEPLPAGREGLIAIRGRNLALGYLDETAWREVYRNGWFVTADRGALDSDGYLVFGGRADDVVNANGHIVHPDEIESRLQGILRAQSFSVVGVPDPRGIKDKIIVLAIEGQSTVTAADITKAMSGSAEFMVPRVIVHVQRLPRTATGKVSRVQLAKQVGEMLS